MDPCLLKREKDFGNPGDRAPGGSLSRKSKVWGKKKFKTVRILVGGKKRRKNDASALSHKSMVTDKAGKSIFGEGFRREILSAGKRGEKSRAGRRKLSPGLGRQLADRDPLLKRKKGKSVT